MGYTYILLLFALLSFSILTENTKADDKVPYIVYLGEPPLPLAGSNQAMEHLRIMNSHFELLGSILGSLATARNSIFYSYTQNINGFAAKLDKDTADKISKLPGVISVFPSRAYSPQTTRSWQFLGLESHGNVGSNSLWRKAHYGREIIIGNLDTGVWPEAESFADDGYGDLPSEWQGICQNDVDTTFTCNKKLIGARYFNKGFEAHVGPLNSRYQTPRDNEGHGTHTLSTAAGNFVANASFFGHGRGTAKGGSPHARVAAYKVCWPSSGCFDSDILAAFDAAVSDGVHVLSVSVGGDPVDYFRDGLAIGSFHAVKNGITVICSAGNSGPTPGSVSNVAPWILTVAASTMDREFPSYVDFRNIRLKGQSLSSNSLPKGKYPIITSTSAKAASSTTRDALLCMLGSLDSAKATGKIVVCTRGTNNRVEKGEAVLRAGGVGMILVNTASYASEIIAEAHVLPATHLTYSDGRILLSYLQSSTVLGKITKPKTVLHTKPAPVMAAFSSQGPNTITPDILKPDITAPGVSVIAAYSEGTSPTGLDFDKRRVEFNSVSGTSMSCPHVSGVVGLLHALHPDWSPAAIRSAIMTTASIKDNQGKKILNSSFKTATPFNYGSGQVNPNAAAHPGLIYDLSTTDYLNFLCSGGYSSSQLASFQQGYQCPSDPQEIKDFNYPSFVINNLIQSVTVSRVTKNVGAASTYTATVEEPSGIRIKVEPDSLKFAVGEEKKFEVTFDVDTPSSNYVFGSITWSNGKRLVRSPVAVLTIS